jgi:xanthine dehydrogenase YagT iron-sulfur-binding subunit
MLHLPIREVRMAKEKDDGKRKGLSRRSFIRRTGVTALGIKGAAIAASVMTAEGVAEAQATSKLAGPGPVPLALRINGKSHSLTLEPRVTLLDALRDWLDLTGAKKVCDRATCGACTVLLDGKAIYSCTMLAIDAQGREITTIEGLAPEGQLHPLSAAFVDNDAQQCGFCTPGFVMACKAFLDHYPNPTRAQMAAALGGNLCRCGTYMGIRQVVMKGGRA